MSGIDDIEEEAGRFGEGESDYEFGTIDQEETSKEFAFVCKEKMLVVDRNMSLNELKEAKMIQIPFSQMNSVFSENGKTFNSIVLESVDVVQARTKLPGDPMLTINFTSDNIKTQAGFGFSADASNPQKPASFAWCMKSSESHRIFEKPFQAEGANLQLAWLKSRWASEKAKFKSTHGNFYQIPSESDFCNIVRDPEMFSKFQLDQEIVPRTGKNAMSVEDLSHENPLPCLMISKDGFQRIDKLLPKMDTGIALESTQKLAINISLAGTNNGFAEFEGIKPYNVVKEKNPQDFERIANSLGKIHVVFKFKYWVTEN